MTYLDALAEHGLDPLETSGDRPQFGRGGDGWLGFEEVERVDAPS